MRKSKKILNALLVCAAMCVLHNNSFAQLEADIISCIDVVKNSRSKEDLNWWKAQKLCFGKLSAKAIEKRKPFARNRSKAEILIG
ncbi:MAG: hypothetical protein ACKO96_42435, partial [Flammeovirgaceae bacterium]